MCSVRVRSPRPEAGGSRPHHQWESGVFDIHLLRDGQMIAEWPSPEMHQRGASAPEGLTAWRASKRVRTDAHGDVSITFRGVRVPQRSEPQPIEFRAYAYNADRVKTLDSPVRIYEPARTSMVSGARAFLITVGVDANQSRNLVLDVAVASAERVKTLLHDKLMQKYPEVIDVSLYSRDEAATQDAGPSASRRNLETVLNLLAGRPVSAPLRDEVDPKHQLATASPDDAVVLYVASHGYADSQGAFYLMPYDTGSNWGITEKQLQFCEQTKQPTQACIKAGDLLQHSVSATELASWWRNIDAQEMVMIVDTCHSGAVPGRDFLPAPLGDNSFGQLAYDKGMEILAATLPLQSEQGKWLSAEGGETTLVEALERVARAAPEETLQQWLEDTDWEIPVMTQQTDLATATDLSQIPVLLDFARSKPRPPVVIDGR